MILNPPGDGGAIRTADPALTRRVFRLSGILQLHMMEGRNSRKDVDVAKVDVDQRGIKSRVRFVKPG